MKVLFIIFVLFSLCFSADGIEIKGLKIGMKYDDILKNFKLTEIKQSYFATMKDNKKITIGGVDTDFVSLEFNNKILESMLFSFKSKSFENVLEAIKTKYKVKCENSKVQNRMGAIFNQVDCSFEDSKSSMFIQKHSKSNVDLSFIGVRSISSDKELIKKLESSKRDI